MVSSIIVAAGSGKRMGKSMNKVFLDLAGFPVLFHSIRAFQEHPGIDEIILVLKEEEIDYYNDHFAGYGFTKVRCLARGGAERMESVQSGLLCLDPASELVLIHDGARPFVSERIISEGIAKARQFGAACPGVIPKDTIKRVDGDGLVSQELDRGSLRALQTPQVFASSVLKSLMADAMAASKNFTDDTSLFFEAGLPVCVYPGSYDNFKITTEEDLALGNVMADKSPE